MSTLVIVPPNKLLRIDKLYAFIGSDETGEGVIGVQLGNTHGEISLVSKLCAVL